MAAQQAQNIPQSLVYEVFRGQPIYYRGYKDILSGKLIAEKMGCSIYQSVLLSALVVWLGARAKKDFFILANELGLNLGKGEKRAADIALYPKERLRGKLTSINYSDVPPQYMIEVDTRADLNELEKPDGYYFDKTQQLLDWGVDRVIWIFTDSRKIMVAEKGKKWTIQSWSEPVRIAPRLIVNIEKLLAEAMA